MPDLVPDPSPPADDIDANGDVTTKQHNEIVARLRAARPTANKVVTTDSAGLFTTSSVGDTQIESNANKNVASGYAGLGADKKLDSAQMPAVVYPPKFTWREIGRTTLGVAGDTITVSGLPVFKELMILTAILQSGTIDASLRFNNDSGSNYAHRQQINGAADTTTVSQTGILIRGSSTDPIGFSVYKITNVSTSEKILEGIALTNNGNGAGNASSRRETAGKWANTVDSITRIDLINAQSGDFTSGSEVVVLALTDNETYPEFWTELGSTTLTSTSTPITVSGLAAKKYLMFQCGIVADVNTTTIGLTFNNDGGSNYAYRAALDGAADTTSVSQVSILPGNTLTVQGSYLIGFVINISANEKLAIMNMNRASTAGANAPSRQETVGKWANTSSQITRVDIIKNSGTGIFGAGSKLIVWGSD